MPGFQWSKLSKKKRIKKKNCKVYDPLFYGETINTLSRMDQGVATVPVWDELPTAAEIEESDNVANEVTTGVKLIVDEVRVVDGIIVAHVTEAYVDVKKKIRGIGKVICDTSNMKIRTWLLCPK